MMPISTTRRKVRFLPDPHRVIAKPYLPGAEVFPDGHSRIELVIDRILAMPESEVAATLAATQQRFSDRHIDLNAILEGNFALVAADIDNPNDLSPDRRLLIGAYFTHEYAIEAAALSNPSIVPAPDQSGLNPGEQRFIMSLRAIGEGHVSSIEYRSGVIDGGGEILVDKPSRYAMTGSRTTPIYDKHAFSTKLGELGAFNDITRMCLDPLPARFTFEQLEAAILDLDRQGVDRFVAFQTTKVIHWLASSNYESIFPAESEISERVIFPVGPTESRGMEDARFVRFTDDDGTVRYYATYTAYDGHRILPQLIETTDFASFRIATLNGRSAQNKGIALFPRKIDGRYAALSRQDNENNFLMLSDNVRFWQETEKIQIPDRP
ncbi:MAG: glycosidase, partial [Acidimicrobiia bacterium]|nr:glycosidase [Acidimicrobiia bacterium]